MEQVLNLVTLLILLAIVYALIGFLLKIIKSILGKEVIFEHEQGILYKNGKLLKVLEAGAHWYCPLDTSIIKLDTRPQLTQVSGQEVLTIDNIPIKVSLTAEFRIENPEAALRESSNYQVSFYSQVQLAARYVIGQSRVEELVSDRETISAKILEIVEPPSKSFGLKVISIGLKDIMLPAEIKKVFSQVLKARKDGEAALERARGETAALRSLANTSRLLESNPTLMQLRTLQAVSETSGNTIVLGVPPSVLPVPGKDRSAGKIDLDSQESD